MHSRYELVQVANGSYSLRSLDVHETFHPVVGPTVEAEALYARQLKLRQRAQESSTLVIWDIGLGAAANVLTAIRHLRGLQTKVVVLSFDHTLEPLRFALTHRKELTYLKEFEAPLSDLCKGSSSVTFESHGVQVDWRVYVADFPALLHSAQAKEWEKPHAILFDAFSPRKNPDMWVHPVFARVYQLLSPSRPCALATYSRSTHLRVSLLLAGFWVGTGEATGEKEETTLAANNPSLVPKLLDRQWLARARRSTSAEPMWDTSFHPAPLNATTWDRLCSHPQFQ